MSQTELVSCQLPIPAGWRFVAFREPSMGEWALSREGNPIEVDHIFSDTGKVIIIEPVNQVSQDDFIDDWPPYMARRVYIAMDERPSPRWIMYSGKRPPVYDPSCGQWSGDVISNLTYLKRAIPGLVLPDTGIVAAESLRWVE